LGWKKIHINLKNSYGNNIILVREIMDRQLKNKYLNPKFIEFLNPKLIGREQIVWNIARRILDSNNLEEIFEITVKEVQKFLEVDRVVIYRFNLDWSGDVVAEAVQAPWMATLGLNIQDPCMDRCWVDIYRRGGVKAIADIRNAGISQCHIELLEKYQVKANLVMPIVPGGTDTEENKLWGLLIAHHCSGTREWDATEAELLPHLATQVAIAIQQAQQHEQFQVFAKRLEKGHTADLELANQLLQAEIKKRKAVENNLEYAKEIYQEEADKHKQLQAQYKRLQTDFSQFKEDTKLLEEEFQRLSIGRTSPLLSEIVRDLQQRGNLSEHVMFEAGQALAKRVRGKDLIDFLEAFRLIGLGNLDLVEATDNCWIFAGDRLIEIKPDSDRPTCNYVRGYLCGTIEHLKSIKTSSKETCCQSMGASRCEFVIKIVGSRE
jgi:GAF domain-containing protein/predicted hydrocarbon binding protein